MLNKNNIQKIFQFLLVRLRVLHCRRYAKIYRISIPSGAIKSVANCADNGENAVFQFLLVRLRDPFEYVNLRFEAHFNSFWCD